MHYRHSRPPEYIGIRPWFRGAPRPIVATDTIRAKVRTGGDAASRSIGLWPYRTHLCRVYSSGHRLGADRTWNCHVDSLARRRDSYTNRLRNRSGAAHEIDSDYVRRSDAEPSCRVFAFYCSQFHACNIRWRLVNGYQRSIALAEAMGGRMRVYRIRRTDPAARRP